MGPEIEPPPTLVDRQAQLAHRIVIGYIHRCERGLTAARADAVVKLFQPASGPPGDGYDMISGCGQILGRRGTKPARGTGDQGKTGGESGIIGRKESLTVGPVLRKSLIDSICRK